MKPTRSLRAVLGAALITLAMSTGSQSAQAATPPQLQMEGNRITHTIVRNIRGPFVPRGVNFMGFESWCTGGSWGQFADHDDAATAQAIAGWKANTVRLPLNQDCWLGEDGYPTNKTSAGAQATKADYQAAVKKFVDLLSAQGLAVILDLHWSGPAGNKADNFPGAPSEGQRPMADKSSIAFWADVANQFKSRTNVMFELYNEPANMLGCTLTWQKWLNGGCTVSVPGEQAYTTVGMQQLVDAIRRTGAGNIILAGGLDWTNDLRGWLAHRPVDRAPAGYLGRWTPRIAAALHAYDGNRCDQPSAYAGNCWDSEVKTVAAQVPVVTTEFGDMQNQAGDTACLGGHHVKDLMTWADGLNQAGQHTIGYLAWVWSPSDDPCANLITSWAGAPTAGSGAALKAQLAKF